MECNESPVNVVVDESVASFVWVFVLISVGSNWSKFEIYNESMELMIADWMGVIYSQWVAEADEEVAEIDYWKAGIVVVFWVDFVAMAVVSGFFLKSNLTRILL